MTSSLDGTACPVPPPQPSYLRILVESFLYLTVVLCINLLIFGVVAWKLQGLRYGVRNSRGGEIEVAPRHSAAES